MSTPTVHPPAGQTGEFDLVEQRLARPAAVMAVGTALSRATGLGRVAAMAIALGVAESRLADSYNIANTLPNIVYELVLGGVLTSVFIPVLVEELRTRTRDQAWRSVSVLVSAAMLVLVAITALTVVAAPWIIDLFSGRVTGPEGAEQHRIATFFLRLFAPQVALYGFTAIGDGLLNAHGRFAVPTFAPILNNVVVIATFLVFAAVTVGTPTNASVLDDTGLKLLLALGTTGGVAAFAAVYLPFLARLPGRIRARVDLRHPAVRKLGRLSSWTFAYVVTNVIGVVVSFYLANGVQGGVTSYVTAFAFFQVPIGIAAVSVITALTPKMAAHHVDGDQESFRHRAAGGLRLCGLLMLPATALYLVLGQPLITTLLEHGVTHARSAHLVASVLRYFAIGLLPFAAFQLLRAAFYARQDARTPAYVNVVENAVTIGLDILLFPLMHVQGLALAHSLGYVVGCVVAVVPLRRAIGGLEVRRTGIEVAKVVLASAVMAAAMLGAVAVIDSAVGPGSARGLLDLAGGGLVGLLVFVALAWMLRVRDMAFFVDLIPARVQRAVRIGQ
ncbi:MAG: murein biosynthesis integral membrane protein MurJ [Actinomycetota bacterium]|nr:murein biosynthesis integral membrane protein MurJ [Actinomycetota bacterium]